MSSLETPQKKEEQDADSYQDIYSRYEAVRELSKNALKEILEPEITKRTIEVILKRIKEN